MKKWAKGFCPLLLLFGLMPAGLLPPAFADPILKSQAPCNKGTPDVCQLFTSAGAPSFVVRSIGFRAPSAGSALVLFQGTLYCAHNLNGREAIDIDTQIVDVETAVAARDQPGGARYLFKLQPGNTSATVSTNASRVFTGQAAGLHDYYFAVNRTTLDPGITCYFYNDSLTVAFVPK